MHDHPDAEPPLVSVVVPVFNVSPYLEQALTSIRSQSLAEIEIICVDDASTDGSIEILRQHARQDPRICILAHKENRGLGAARNTGLRQALGRYVYFFDSDDLLEIDALRGLTELAESRSLDVVFFNARPLIDDSMDPSLLERYERQYRRVQEYESGVPGYELFCRMSASGDWKPSACLYLSRRELLMRQRGFPEGVLHEDNGFTARIALSAVYAGYDPSTYFIRRVRSHSITTGPIAFVHLRGLIAAVGELLVADRESSGGTVDHAGVGQALSFEAERLFCDVVEKYSRVSGEEGQLLLDWEPGEAVEAFVKRRLLEKASSLHTEAALAECGEEIRRLSSEHDALRSSRVLRIARRLRSLLPPY